MKRLVIFADGTWSSPEKGGATNVLQMARGLKSNVIDKNTGEEVEQIAFYDWGVGTDRKKMTGGITGEGIDKNIMDCYRFLVHNYNKGDQLFFFGFSRGAYTVRSLGGFVRNCGLLKKEKAHLIPDAFKLYRKRTKTSNPNAAMSVNFRKKNAVADITPIEFIGVWDTVGALGIPVPFWGTLGERELLFHDTEPSKIINHARHALAIDECREDFLPTLWSEKPGLDLQQVWFSGVHSDVGGGYEELGLSYCAAKWIIQEASNFGLAFEPHYIKTVKADPFDKLHNSRKGIYLARKEAIRDIDGPIHRSVKKRWDKDSDRYQKKSKALKKLLKSVDGDWKQLNLVD